MSDAPKPTVVEAFSAVMEDVQGIAKHGRVQTNSATFNFRGIDAVMNAVGPALRKHGVVILPNVEEANYRDVEVGKNRTIQRECTVRVRYVIHGPAGDTIEGIAYGEALDSGDKGTAKATSVAYRTFLLQGLTIPTDEPDPDTHVVERAPRQEESPYISAANVEAMRRGCADAGVDIADVVAAASDNRTSDPAELYKSEVPAARDALQRLAAGPMPTGGDKGDQPALPELSTESPVSVVEGAGEPEPVPAGSPATRRRNGGGS